VDKQVSKLKARYKYNNGWLAGVDSGDTCVTSKKSETEVNRITGSSGPSDK
jgi:hypothetical protein